MTLASNLSTICPNLSRQFLALEPLPEVASDSPPALQLYKGILTHFDTLTSGNLRDCLTAESFLLRHQPELQQLPLLLGISQALYKWSKLDYEGSHRLFIEHLERHPSDIVALFMLHMLDFCTGKTTRSIDVIHAIESGLAKDHEHHTYLLGIKAFVLCEANQPEEALKQGLHALALDSSNIYAIHAVAHAHHEMGNQQAVNDFLEQYRPNWIQNPGMRMHVCWHQALSALNLAKPKAAAELFRQFYSMKTDRHAEQDLDAVGFLWRYRLKYPIDKQFDPLWELLADNWTGCIGASVSYFHDIHAALTFAAVGKSHLIEKLIARSNGLGVPQNTHQTGLKILRALLAYSVHDYATTADLLVRSRDSWSQIGGSRAQRELLSLTLEQALSNLDPINRIPQSKQSGFANQKCSTAPLDDLSRTMAC